MPCVEKRKLIPGCCTKIDKYLKRVNPRSRETPTATSRRPTIEDAPAGDSNPGCSSKSTSDQCECLKGYGTTTFGKHCHRLSTARGGVVGDLIPKESKNLG